jgi:hypothetical protein
VLSLKSESGWMELKSRPGGAQYILAEFIKVINELCAFSMKQDTCHV